MQRLAPPIVLLLLMATGLHAHPGVSGARIDQQVVIRLSDAGVVLEYTTQLNRPAAFLEVVRMDLNGDEQLLADEQARYFQRLADVLTAGLELRLDGRQIALKPGGEVELSMPFRKLYRFEIPHPDDWQEGVEVELHNDNYLDLIGQINVTLLPEATIDVTAESILQEEPDWDMTIAPTGRHRDAFFHYAPGTGLWTVPEEDADPLVATDTTTGDTTYLPPASKTTVAAILAMGIAAVTLLFTKRLAPATMLGLVSFAVVVFVMRGRTDASIPNEHDATRIFQSLHRSIYEGFKQPTESDLYDTLARGLDGDVLEEVFHEIHQARFRRDRRTRRFDVRRVKPLETTLLPNDQTGSYRVRYRWRVYGTVTHFGHTHARFNEYEAIYRVGPTERGWRIVDSQTRQNKRVTIGDDQA